MIIGSWDALFAVLLLITAFSAFYLIVFYWAKSKHDGLLFSFTAVFLCIMIWSLGVMARIVTIQGSEANWFVIRCYYSGICFIGVSWLIFCLYYTNSAFVKKKHNIILLLIPPIICYGAVLTNDFHQLFFYKYQLHIYKRNYNFMFWIHSAFSYVYIFYGTTRILFYAIRRYGFSRIRSILLALGNLIPTFTSTLVILYHPSVDITPLSFLLSSAMLSVAMLKFRLFSIIPISALTLLDSMKDGVVIINNNNTIESMNASMSRHFKEVSMLKAGDESDVFYRQMRSSLEMNNESIMILHALESGTKDMVSGKVKSLLGDQVYFIANVLPVADSAGKIIGRIGVFSDVSDYVRLDKSLEIKNAQLVTAYDKLVRQTLRAEEVAILKERERISKDIHDSVGHTLTLLSSLLGVMRITWNKEPSKLGEQLINASEVVKKGLKNLRESLQGLKNKTLESDGLHQALEKLFEEFRLMGLLIDFSIEGDAIILDYSIRYVIYRTCQEALTNSIRHGNAKNVSVLLCFSTLGIKLFIFDDGIGCKKLQKRMGLSGMDERVASVGGSISLGSMGDTGFSIHIDIPLEKKSQEENKK